MPVPAKKTIAYLEEVGSICSTVSEIRVWTIIQDCRKLAKGADHLEAADLHQVIGHAFLRLGRDQEALNSFRIASQLHTANVGHLNNVGVALLRLHRPAEALAVMQYVWKLDEREPIIVELGNLGEALAGVGRREEAEDLFWYCVNRVDYKSANETLSLTSFAAELGFTEYAIGIFARHVAAKMGRTSLGNISPIQFILDAPEEYKTCLLIQPHIKQIFDHAQGRSLEAHDSELPPMPQTSDEEELLPEKYRIRARMKLDPDEWSAFLGICEDAPQPSEALRGLFNAKH
jgi:hypothetical protein